MKCISGIILVFTLFTWVSANEFVVPSSSAQSITIPGLKEECFDQTLRAMQSMARTLESLGAAQQFIIQESLQMINGSRITKGELEIFLQELKLLEGRMKEISRDIQRFKSVVIEKKEHTNKRIKRS